MKKWRQYTKIKLKTKPNKTKIDTEKKNKKEMLGIKNSVLKMKNAFNRLISRLDIAKERIKRLEDVQ